MFILDPWPIGGLTAIGKSKEGVEAVMDFDKFISRWEQGRTNFTQIFD